MDGSTAMILAGRLVQIKTVTNYLIKLKNSGFGTGNLVQSYAKRLAVASLFALVRMKGLEPSRLAALAPKASVSTNSTTSAYKLLNTRSVSTQNLRFTQPPHPHI